LRLDRFALLGMTCTIFIIIVSFVT